MESKRRKLREAEEKAERVRSEVEEEEQMLRREAQRRLRLKHGWEIMGLAMGGCPWNGTWYEEDENGGGIPSARDMDGFLWLGEPDPEADKPSCWVANRACDPRYVFREGWMQEKPTGALGRSPWKFVSGWFPMPSKIPVRWRRKAASWEPKEGVIIYPPGEPFSPP